MLYYLQEEVSMTFDLLYTVLAKDVQGYAQNRHTAKISATCYCSLTKVTVSTPTDEIS